MQHIQVGTLAYKNALTGEYELAKPIFKPVTKELEQAEKELTSQILSFFANEFKNSKNKPFKR